MRTDVAERNRTGLLRKDNSLGNLQNSGYNNDALKFIGLEDQRKSAIVEPDLNDFFKDVISDAAPLSSSIVPIQPVGSKTPLFCIHAGGGDVVFYADLSVRLGKNQPLYGIQAKGVDGAELPFSKMEKMAAFYIDEIRKVQPEGPYQLAGYCLGARIAFEMTQQLTRDGHEVTFLANLNGISPTYGHVSQVANSQFKLKSGSFFAKVYSHINRIRTLSLKQKAAYVLKRLKMQVLSKIITPFYLLRFKAYEAIFKLYLLGKQKAPQIIAKNYVSQSLYILQCNYRPKVYEGTIHVFSSAGMYIEPSLGWKDFVKGKIETIEIAGTHQTRRDMMNEPHVQYLANELKNCMDRSV